MTPEQATEIMRLRAGQVAPKQIARKLGLRPAAVKTFIQESAEAAYLQQVGEGNVAPLHECLVNQSAAQRLLEGIELDEGVGVGGFAEVIMARQERNRIVSTAYLVDYWCLGVKDVIPPRTRHKSDYERFKHACIERFKEPFIDISLAQAQAIVYGAADYARGLGFEPGRDFDQKAQMQLGPKPETLIPIEFGKNGKPMYFRGPYDDAEKIIKTLTANVGPGNFGSVMALGALDNDPLFLE
ncbi:DNA-binding response regulator [Halomicronema sp. CCY15110]|uniref:DNA-binding response regulator n=1 Tax=Halomicronema sp. CCY15110 TaxID=2767773 RepID=UPI00194F5588|nr:DNA-binding response regulator [Halomicronema sp. CCY15110]